MSSATRSSTQQQSSETTTKKKFGKNLNKLTKPPAPPISSGPKANASSRNGLLLLSTKRPSSGVNTASSTGGILSNKSSQVASKPLPSLGLQYESSTSTHDALLGAVVGASRAEAQQQPDAWGVADKKGSVGEPNSRTEENPAPQAAPSSKNPSEEFNAPEKNEAETHSGEAPISNWDEYGGREVSREKYENEPDVQGTYMSQLARERAEKHRVEEETRQSAQKERATQRLRELEQKMITGNESPSEGAVSQSEVERLERSQSISEEYPPNHSGTSSTERTSQRTLYDPNRTYSSLVGGGAKDEKELRSGLPDASAQLRNGRTAQGGYAQDPQQFSDSRDPKYNRQPIIHLSSYEDRDRGERGTSAGPRMLYDPKSGSMVAVPSREDTAASGRGRKDRGKKGKNVRDKEGKVDLKPDTSNDSSKGGRKGKQRREEIVNQRKESGSQVKIDSKKGRILSDRKLPRTCGVLYAKDNKGNYFCADGCDGDLGYGAHSVPGGHTRNPDAYAKFRESREQAQGKESDTLDSRLENSINSGALQGESTPGVTLHTGFGVPESNEVKHDWIKPNEKIELITGIADSPTLQATAKAWAPSRTALAAAVAAAGKAVKPSSTDKVDEQVEDDVSPFGLGFDPTLNMNSVMHSPSAEPESRFDTVNLATLSLEPALQGTANSANIFAFESGATWGSNNTTGGNGATWGSTHVTASNDWGMPSSGVAFSNDDPNSSVMANAFLSLPSTNTWGAVPGLGGGASLGGSSLNGEQTRSTGD